MKSLGLKKKVVVLKKVLFTSLVSFYWANKMAMVKLHKVTERNGRTASRM